MSAYKELALSFLSDAKPRPRFVAFDVETTGLKAQHEEIVEIGAVSFDSLGIISRYSVLINPGRPMPPNVTAINGITDAMLKDKPSIGEVFGDFLAFIEGATLVAHNAPFDMGFINTAFARLGEKKAVEVPYTALPNPVLDTIFLGKTAFPGRPSYKLQDLAAWRGIKAEQAHRAEDDARVCYEFFLDCLKAIAGENS